MKTKVEKKGRVCRVIFWGLIGHPCKSLKVRRTFGDMLRTVGFEIFFLRLTTLFKDRITALPLSDPLVSGFTNLLSNHQRYFLIP
jgi:hypothetical protein